MNYSELGIAPAAEPVVEARHQRRGRAHPLAGAIATLDPVERIIPSAAEVLPFIFETLTRDRGEARIVPWRRSNSASKRADCGTGSGSDRM